MKLIYTDAGFSYQKYEKLPEAQMMEGIICVTCDDFQVIEKVGVGRVEGLKQYINIFELIAIARGIELMIEKKIDEDVSLFTDSFTAKTWATKDKINTKRFTAAHDNALTYFRDMMEHFPHVVAFNHVLRDDNPAGKLLELEAEKNKS